MRIFFLTAITILMVGCSSAPLRLPDDNAEQTARISSYHREFPATPFNLVYVPSKGGISNSITLAGLRSGTGSANSKKLASLLRQTTDQNARVAITGPDDELTAETLLDALGRLEGKRLDGFHLVYIGAPGYEEKLRAEVNKTGATFVYVRHPGP